MSRIVSRSAWGARSATGTTRTTWSKRTTFAVHHSGASADQTPREIQDFHMNSRGWSDIGYNFLVGDDGTIYHGRGWLTVGAHIAGHNTECVGVCVIGNYVSRAVPEPVKDALAWLYDEANRRAGKTLRIRTHGQLASTACPGERLADWVTDHLADHNGGGGGTGPKPDVPPTGSPAPGPEIAFPLPQHYYFGPRTGGAASVSGHHGRTFNGRTDTEWLQEWARQLERRGWSIGRGKRWLPVYGNDGRYGSEYRALAIAFQNDQGLVPDGLIGPKTWAAAYRNPVTD
ncbi:N-acetylmuramoyl-L-alanine amidase [Glycomyces sp. NPDC048151]|uniref:peptidoglycan recognition protein family protein n=1 Tax=Glycomyces sp. NPDC048151 TaxID=3364002 RepID=UPI00371A44F1